MTDHEREQLGKAARDERPPFAEIDPVFLAQMLVDLDARLRVVEPCPKAGVEGCPHVWTYVDGPTRCRNCQLPKVPR